MISKKKLKNCLKTAHLLLLQEVNDLVEEFKRGNRIWMRNWISERNIKGGSTMLLGQLASEDPSEYRLAMRMTQQDFEELLSLISNNIQRSDTLFRVAFYLHLFANFLEGRLAHISVFIKIRRDVPETCMFSVQRDKMKSLVLTQFHY